MDKLVSRKEIGPLSDQYREEGKTIVLANGAFDVLHVGHVRYLTSAKECGDVLVVAVNSDRSVRLNKGEGRPVMPDYERAELLCALSAVDHVLIFDELTVSEVILELRPHVHCKGTDYTEESVPEAEIVKSVGGVVRIVGDPKDHDSSGLIEKINSNIDNDAGTP